ncbi:ergothioneine biosynthesis protein EgtC [Streptomyces avicenniae]|uniref:ergothioneine biosynthesis protein EgtC n=1 Tax=Streptomyces avicenniae TaxID=500153 RepID=UPI00069B4D8E|nr:ergothioneine biosynthesis protein EgtC [Streptomyces avicenniae]
MCRHLAYLGPERPLAELITAPPHSLYEQSWSPRLQSHGTVNADGFGIGWYPPGSRHAPPVRYRRAIPIWADANLPGLLDTLRSGVVVAAVRDATAGNSRDEAASAPFASGRWLFSHNGAVDDWESLPADTGEPLTSAELLGLEARSDSALLWVMVARRLTSGHTPADALADVVRRTRDVRPDARLNLLLTDGGGLTAVRLGSSLWYRAARGQVTVASEPVPEEPGWNEIPDHSLLTTHDSTVRIKAL